MPALREIGLDVPVTPDGAFYAWADCSRFGSSSWDLAIELLDATGVAITPGRDFGLHDPDRWLRISYATSLEQMQQAVERMARHLRSIG